MKDVLDFIVIGAQKSATTTLFEHLRRHPELALPVAKEAPFFSHEENYRRGWRAYMDELTRGGGISDPAKVWGTVTPQYMMGGTLGSLPGTEADPHDERTVPRRMHAQLPDVRLVAILRDPVQRAISHHSMVRRRGGELRDFDDAVEQLLRPEELRASRAAPTETNGYITWGEYSRILGGYLDVFPRERLLILFTDELERAPLELLSKLFGFIDVSKDFVPENPTERYFRARQEAAFDWHRPVTWMSPSSPLSPQGLQRGVRALPGTHALWRALPFQTRRRLWQRYWRTAARARAANRRRAVPDRAAELAPRPETIERLREHFAQDIPRLTAMLDGAAPPWATPGPPPPRAREAV